MSKPFDVIISPAPRQVLVIAERGRLIGFCLACRPRSGDKIAYLVCGVADGTTLMPAEFKASKEETDATWRREYPEAQIVYLRCPEEIHPQQFARLVAERRVSA